MSPTAAYADTTVLYRITPGFIFFGLVFVSSDSARFLPLRRQSGPPFRPPLPPDPCDDTGASYLRMRSSTCSAPSGLRPRAYALTNDPKVRSSGATALSSILAKIFSARSTSPWFAQWSMRLV